jgi:putative transposase
VACRILGVSRSGFYEWRNRPPSAREQENELLLKHITDIHRQSRETYGSPRVHAELTLGLGLPVNLKRVARLMRQAGIQGLYRRRRRGCTMRDPHAEPAVDLVNRQFAVDGPDRLWFTDITEHPTEEGKLYCAAVMDAYSRRIVGWSMAEHIRTELVLDARHGHRPPQTGRRAHGTAFRPRLAIHLVGVWATPAERRITRLDG